MNKSLSVLVALLIGFCAYAENEGLHVYDPVPGLAPSEHYTFRVRTVGSSTWLSPHAFITRVPPSNTQNDASRYYSQYLGDWTNTYINFEMAPSTPVEIEIAKVSGAPINKAVAHPHQKVVSTELVDGKAYVVIEDPALFTVDIDGQMDDQDTGRISPTGWFRNAVYRGPPIHTLTIFANPFLSGKPQLGDPGVLAVEPGTVPPETGSWTTLYFKPGVHRIGKAFRVYKDKNYYIPGDAVVHGTFNNYQDWSSGTNIRIFGHGTLSGEEIPHPADDPSPAPGAVDGHYKPIEIVGARDTVVEGITVADSANHSLMLINPYNANQPSIIRWAKIFTWRGNGDGINPFGNTLIEDCFIRTQDDCVYVNGHGIRRVTFWTDTNGSIFVLSPVGDHHPNPIIVEDCDILYNRSVFFDSTGGCVFNLRGEGSGSGGQNIVFQNIRVHDKRPTRQAFAIAVASPWQKSPNYERVRGSGDIVGITFRNIDIAAPAVIGQKDALWGTSNARLREFKFIDVTLAGEPIDGMDHFSHNDYVADMQFLTDDLIMEFNGSDWVAGDGYAIDGDRWIDTGALAGWLQIIDGPWVWSFDLQSPLYLPATRIGSLGAWAYAPR